MVSFAVALTVSRLSCSYRTEITILVFLGSCSGKKELIRQQTECRKSRRISSSQENKEKVCFLLITSPPPSQLFFFFAETPEFAVRFGRTPRMTRPPRFHVQLAPRTGSQSEEWSDMVCSWRVQLPEVTRYPSNPKNSKTMAFFAILNPQYSFLLHNFKFWCTSDLHLEFLKNALPAGSFGFSLNFLQKSV